ncbi:MAG: porin [Bacteroidia bacterium]|nr:porin [Bacteroidia bacterium]
MRKTFKALLLCGLMAMTGNVYGQITVPTANGDLKLRIMGRTNVDAGIFVGEDGDDRDGVVMNDTRLGVQANFDEKYAAKIEVCFVDKAISFRDLWVSYSLDTNKTIKFGNFFMPYGSKILGLAYKFVEDAPVDYTFCPLRKIGAAYEYSSDPINFTVGVFSDGNVDARGTNKGYNLAAQAIVRPVLSEEKVLHFGVAPLFTKSDNAVTLKGIVPVTFATPQQAVVSTGAMSAKSQFRYEVEALYINKRFMWETHFMGTSVDLMGEDNYDAQGVFTQMSWHLIGTQQKYNKKTGLVANAAPKTLELLLRADYLNLKGIEDAHYGEQLDLTLGLNYFFSKYLNFKFNYVYAAKKNDTHFNAIQGRLQFSF